VEKPSLMVPVCAGLFRGECCVELNHGGRFDRGIAAEPDEGGGAPVLGEEFLAVGV
jgi:hypothetical protein